MRRASLTALSLIMIILTGCAASSATSEASTQPSVATATHPELRDQLNELFKRDQAARYAMIEAMKEGGAQAGGTVSASPELLSLMQDVQAIDAETSAFLRTMIAEHGWPTFDMQLYLVGLDGRYAGVSLQGRGQNAVADLDRGPRAERLEGLPRG